MPARALRRLFPIIEKIAPKYASKLAWYFFLHPIKYPIPQPEVDCRNKSSRWKEQHEGHNVKVYLWGNKESENKVLLVHGWAGRTTQYWKIIDELSSLDYVIYGVDFPGHGGSEGNSTNIPQMAKIINELIDKYDINHLVGHSLGGAASIYALQKSASKIEKLILISAPTSGELMLNDYLNKLNGRSVSLKTVQKNVQETFNQPLNSFFAEEILPINNFPETLAFHDHEDQEVGFEHLQILVRHINNILTVETDHLGHTKILRNEEVISKISSFLQIA